MARSGKYWGSSSEVLTEGAMSAKVPFLMKFSYDEFATNGDDYHSCSVYSDDISTATTPSLINISHNTLDFIETTKEPTYYNNHAFVDDTGSFTNIIYDEET